MEAKIFYSIFYLNDDDQLEGKNEVEGRRKGET